MSYIHACLSADAFWYHHYLSQGPNRKLVGFPYISYNVSPNKVFKTMRTPKPEFVSGSPLAQLS